MRTHVAAVSLALTVLSSMASAQETPCTSTKVRAGDAYCLAYTYFEQIASLANTPSTQAALNDFLKEPAPEPVSASKVIFAFREHLRVLHRGILRMVPFERSVSVDARDTGKGVRMAFSLMAANDSLMLTWFKSVIDMHKQPPTSELAERIATGRKRGEAAYDLLIAAASGVQIGLIAKDILDPKTRTLSTLALTQQQRDTLIGLIERTLPRVRAEYSDDEGYLFDGPKALLKMLRDTAWRVRPRDNRKHP